MGRLQVMPVIQWDDHPFLNMKPDPEVGPLALALRGLLVEDLDPTKDRYNPHFTPQWCCLTSSWLQAEPSSPLGRDDLCH